MDDMIQALFRKLKSAYFVTDNSGNNVKAFKLRNHITFVYDNINLIIQKLFNITKKGIRIEKKLFMKKKLN